MALPDSNFSTNRKAVFEKDFTSLVAEKQGVTGIRRLLSPSLSSSVESFSIGSCGEKWTSVLAEVPAILASNGMANSPIQPRVFTASNSSSRVSTTGGPNMAEALSQPVARHCATIEVLKRELSEWWRCLDSFEPPQFKHKRVPMASASAPVSVMHSPPRQVTVKDQQDCKIPPCISNWKNPKGYTIPLDNRLAPNGRELQEVQINDNFPKLSEAYMLQNRKPERLS